MRDVAGSLALNFLKSELQSCNLLQNASVPNEGGVGKFC